MALPEGCCFSIEDGRQKMEEVGLHGLYHYSSAFQSVINSNIVSPKANKCYVEEEKRAQNSIILRSRLNNSVFIAELIRNFGL
jgi:hypothetical protein